MKTIWLTAEKESASDEALSVIEFLVDDNETVETDQILAEIEGSKSVFELRAPRAGVVHLYAARGDLVPIGAPIVAITDKSEPRPDFLGTPAPSLANNKAKQTDGLGRFSQKALVALKERGLDPISFLPEKPFVTLNDVEASEQKGSASDAKPGFTRIAFVGGGYGALLAQEVLSSHSNLRLVGFFDDTEGLLATDQAPRWGEIDKQLISQMFQDSLYDKLFIAVQHDQKVRQDLASWTREKSIPLATLVHKNASISDTATLGEGSLIMDGGRIAQHAVVGRNVFLSGMVNVDHHVEVGENTTFGPGVFLSGGVKIGRNCRFASGIVVESHLSIGSDSTISSGSVIRANVPADSFVKTISNVEVRKTAQNGKVPPA